MAEQCEHVFYQRPVEKAGIAFQVVWCLLCRCAWPTTDTVSGLLSEPPTWRVIDDDGHIESVR
jgi:hypothetical protein